MITVGLVVATSLVSMLLGALYVSRFSPSARRGRASSRRREHERLTGWFPALRTPSTGGRHRLEDKLTSQENNG